MTGLCSGVAATAVCSSISFVFPRRCDLSSDAPALPWPTYEIHRVANQGPLRLKVCLTRNSPGCCSTARLLPMTLTSHQWPTLGQWGSVGRATLHRASWFPPVSTLGSWRRIFCPTSDCSFQGRTEQLLSRLTM